MRKAKPKPVDSAGSEDFRKLYHAQKRLIDGLFGLFQTLGSTLNFDRVARVGLLTLTEQLLIQCAAFFESDDRGNFRVLTVVGSRRLHQTDLLLPRELPQLIPLLRDRKLIHIDTKAGSPHPAFEHLSACGFRYLFPLSSRDEILGAIALGEKIVHGPLTVEDSQILETFSVVMSVCIQNSLAYQLVETSRNELQRLNEMKREFMSHVSHEFRTPLTILKNAAEMSDLDPEIGEMHQSALARLEHLINSVLLFNEVNSMGVELDCMMVDARSWLEEEMRPMLARHGDFDLESELPKCTLEFDCQKVRTAVESVVDNAVKFGSKGAKAKVHVYLTTREHAKRCFRAGPKTGTLETGLLRAPKPIDPCSPDALLVIEVRDRGIGIPPAELDAVFQPFTQAANSPTRNIKGSGLGLTMARRIAEAHGGETHCRSAVEQGTIVYIMIPAIRIGGDTVLASDEPH